MTTKNRDSKGHFVTEECRHDHKAEQDEPKAPATCTVNWAGGVYVRTEPRKDSKIVRVLVDGANIEVLETTDGWHRLADGWTMAKFTK